MPELETAPIVATESDWANIFPEPFRKDPLIAKYKNGAELAEGIRSLNETIGRKGVLVPKPDAPQAEWDAFNETVAGAVRPAKPEDYKLTPPDQLHPSVKINPEVQKWFQTTAHAAGMSNKQANALYQGFLNNSSAAAAMQEKAQLEARQKGETALRTAWGAHYDQNIALATRLAKQIGGQELLDALGDRGNHPVVLRTFARLAGALSEDSMKTLGISSLSTASASDAKAQIDRINADMKHAYWNKNDPNHSKAVKEMRELHLAAEQER